MGATGAGHARDEQDLEVVRGLPPAGGTGAPAGLMVA